MNTVSPSRARISPWLTGTGVLLLLVILAFSVLIFQNFTATQAADATFRHETDLITDLTNIQRGNLLLQLATNNLLSGDAPGLEEIDRYRAALASQVRIFAAQSADRPQAAQAAQDIQRALDEYDALLTPLRQSPSPAAYAQARPAFDALFKRLDVELIKPAYDNIELAFYQSISDNLKIQQRAQVLMMVLGVFFIVFSGGLGAAVFNTSRRIAQLTEAQVQTLEERVAERTRALQLAAQVSQRISAIRNQAQMVVEVVEQLKQAFNYYHAHIYLFDEKEENLVMAGGTGEVGQTLLQRRHSIPRGKGLVGRAAESKQAVVVADTHADPAWLPNPLLPETRAEIAVPILFGGRVLGVLDVQNDRTASLSELDALLIGAVADQVGIALENLRANQLTERLFQDYQTLIETSPAAIAILDAESGLFVQANPQMLELFELTPEDVGKTGPIQLSPPTQPDGQPSETAATARIQRALQQGGAVFEWIHRTRSGREFRSEIRLSPAPDREGRPMLNAIITDITARYQSEQQARRRAEREAILNRLTQQIQSATRIEDALQIAVREIGHALGQRPALVTLEPDVNRAGEKKSN
ncbi:MAG: hypothetical protein OHK0010_03940 [Anaerolineales bacterium]